MGKSGPPVKPARRATAQYCEYRDCNKKQAFFIRWAEMDGRISSGIVCASHDKQLGRINLMNAYGIAHEEAVSLDNALTRAAKREDEG